MQPDPWASLIAWWGAGLSTLLAVVKLWELWRGRFRIDVSYNFAGSADVGNEIYLRNLTANPLILTHWELGHCSGVPPFRRFSLLSFADPDAGDQVIPQHSTYTLRFVQHEHFDWGAKVLRERGAIVIRLHVAGRKPIQIKVYPK
jgi:hypothetical protein